MTNTKNHHKILYIIVIFSLAFFPLFSKATHILGAELYYECTSPNSNFYQVTLKMWRECSVQNADFQDSVYIAIYDTSGNLVNGPNGLKLQNPIRDTLTNPNCINEPATACVEEAIYQGSFVFGPNPEAGGYYLTFQQCCRNYNIVNISNSGDVGFSTFIKIPETSLASCNNSIQFGFPKKTFICIGDTLSYDFSANEVDGDSIIYEFCNATDGDFIDVSGAPNAYIFPSKFINTFYPVTYLTTMNYVYSATNPVYAPNIPFNIDAFTGKITGLPEQEGRYAVAVCASEYRNGQLLSTTKREFDFIVTSCTDTSINASISLQGNTLSAQSADTYQWLNCDSNYAHIQGAISSTFTPTITGSYAVALTANSATCKDTSDCQSVVITEVNEIEANKLDIFPNPTSNSLKIHGINGSIVMRDILGRIVKTGNTPTLDLSDINKGVYFINISTTDGRSITKKVVKE